MRRRVIPVLVLALLVSAAWSVFERLDFTPSNRVDTDALILIGTAFTAAAVVQLAGSPGWNLRGLGLLSTMAGDAGLYGNAAMVRLHWRAPLREKEIALILSLLSVGGCLLLVGIVWWVIVTRFGTRPDGRDQTFGAHDGTNP